MGDGAVADGQASFTISLSEPLASDLTITYNMATGSTAGAPQTVVIPAGQASVAMSVPVPAGETLTLTVTEVQAAGDQLVAIADASGTTAVGGAPGGEAAGMTRKAEDWDG